MHRIVPNGRNTVSVLDNIYILMIIPFNVSVQMRLAVFRMAGLNSLALHKELCLQMLPKMI